MALLAVNDILRVTVYCKSGTQVSQNVLNYIVDAVAGMPTEAMVANDLSILMASAIAGVLNVGARYEGLRLQRLPPFPTQGVTTTQDNTAGSVGGDQLPPQVAGLIKKLTDSAGRAGRGRFYVPFPSEADGGAGGKPTSTYLANLADLRTVIAGAAGVGSGGNTVDLVGLVIKSGPVPGLPKRITSTSVASSWATQRRRSFINRGDNLPL